MSTISNAVFEEFPGDMNWLPYSVAIVESPAEIRTLDPALEEDRRVAGEFGRGLAFGPMAEVRWMRTSEGLHMVLVSDEDEVLPRSRKSRRIRPVGEGAVFAWGKWSEAEEVFREDRIPRLFRRADAGSAREDVRDSITGLEVLRYPMSAGGFEALERAAVGIKRYRMTVRVPDPETCPEVQSARQRVIISRCVGFQRSGRR